jgi:hypothetical protein
MVLCDEMPAKAKIQFARFDTNVPDIQLCIGPTGPRMFSPFSANPGDELYVNVYTKNVGSESGTIIMKLKDHLTGNLIATTKIDNVPVGIEYTITVPTFGTPGVIMPNGVLFLRVEAWHLENITEVFDEGYAIAISLTTTTEGVCMIQKLSGQASARVGESVTVEFEVRNDSPVTDNIWWDVYENDVLIGCLKPGRDLSPGRVMNGFAIFNMPNSNVTIRLVSGHEE